MKRRVVNVYERRFDAPATTVGALLDTLGQAEDRLWPNRSWPPLVLDGPVGVGAAGGHGPIRCRVSAYVPGRSVTCTFVDEVGIHPGDASAFDPVEVADHELLLGTDAGHLDLRASILVGDRRVVVTTLVRANNRRGRAYLAVIRPLHRRVIRAMLARAHRRLATPPTAGAAPVEGASG